MASPTCVVVYGDGVKCTSPAVRINNTLCWNCYRWSHRRGGVDPNGRRRFRPKGALLAFLQSAAHATTDECIIVTGYSERPKIEYQGTMMWCSRAVWFMAHGNPGRLWVLHTCHRGDEGCVNIRHLYLGDSKRNVVDRDDAGRTVRGEDQRGARLTEDDVRKIRELLADDWTQTAAAKEFGVSPRTVSDIARGRRWAWLDAGHAASPTQDVTTAGTTS
ncbi:helix-turn-helix domain-containing protein [Streptomyces cellulosae]